MKNYFLLFMLFILASCSDPCKDVLCGTYGACDEGLCICETGTYGDNCEKFYRDDFIGDWGTTQQSCDVGNALPQTYTFSAGDKIDEIKITSSITPDLLLIAKVGTTSFVIEDQVIVFGIPVTLSGSGTLGAVNTATLILKQVVEGQDDRTCTYELFKN